MLAAALVAAGLVLAPILALLATALSGGSATLLRLSATVLPASLADTALLLAGVATLAGTVGVGTAWLVTAHRFPGSRPLAWLLPLPLAVPTYVLAFIYVELLDAAGPVQAAVRALGGFRLRSEYAFPEVRSLPGCIAILSLALYPYVFVPARAAFLKRSRAAGEAARTLGAGGARVFFRVALPMARPAIAAGIVLALLETLNDVGATEFLGIRTLTLAAFTVWQNGGDLTAASQLAAVTLAAVILLLGLGALLGRDARRGPSSSEMKAAEPAPLRGVRAALAAGACAVPVALGLVLPLLFLCHEVVRRDLLFRLPDGFGRHLATSVLLAGIATATILAFALPVVLAPRAGPERGLPGAAAGLAGLGYAVPGTFVVLGLFGATFATDRVVAALGGSAAGGVMLTGTLAGLVLAYLIRFLRVASGPLAAQLAAGGRDLEAAARVLGAFPLTVARRIQLPLLRPALAAAALLVFVDCLKELPATLLLRPLNVETMATLVYGAAARGTFEDGALAALVIVLTCLPAVYWLTRATGGSASARRPPA